MITADENLVPRRYFVKHRTAYTYPEPVLQCIQRGFLGFRKTSSQRIIAHDFLVTPEPLTLSEHVDRFGNDSYYLEIHTPHTRLEVVKEAIVEVGWERVDVDALDQWSLESARRAIASSPGHGISRAMFGLPSRLVQVPATLEDYTATILVDAMGFGAALVELTRNIYRDFTYLPGATSVRTTVEELLDLRAGVCQDFAHFGLAVLRSQGIPARYISGYLETQPPPGKEKLEGSDASHAWLAAMAPDGQWIHLDPTNDQFADSRYVVASWGRDFSDASPLRGVIQADGVSSKLKVGVDVVRIEGEALPHFSVTDLELSS